MTCTTQHAWDVMPPLVWAGVPVVLALVIAGFTLAFIRDMQQEQAAYRQRIHRNESRWPIVGVWLWISAIIFFLVWLVMLMTTTEICTG